MLRLRRLSWFPELWASVLDFHPDTTVRRVTLITIPMDTIGIRTSTIIPMPGIDIHITLQHQVTRTLGIGVITVIIATTIITASKFE
jgi:hypothetical protein